MKIKELTKLLDKIAPASIAESWDNVGLLVGDDEAEIHKALVCLDVTDSVIKEALDIGADIIISHHPMIFKGIKRVTSKDILGEKLISCIKNNIAIYSMHTNFDLAFGGLNDILFDYLELEKKESLQKENEQGYALGRIGVFSEIITLEALVTFVKDILNLKSVKFTGDRNKSVKRVAVATGACSSYEMFNECLSKNCDVFITSDIKHHEALDALEMGLCLIDATHYGTEFIMVKELSNKLRKLSDEQNSNLTIVESKKNQPVFDFI